MISERMLGLLILSLQITIFCLWKVPDDVKKRYSAATLAAVFVVMVAVAFINLYVAMRALMLITGWS